MAKKKIPEKMKEKSPSALAAAIGLAKFGKTKFKKMLDKKKNLS
jgi:hypothetical protein